MKTIYKTTLSIFLFSVLMVFGAKTAMGAFTCDHLIGPGYRFQTVYTDNVPQIDEVHCDSIPFEIETTQRGTMAEVCLTPKDGFKITNYYSNQPDGKTLCLEIEINTTRTPVNWAGDGLTKDLIFDYKILDVSQDELDTLNIVPSKIVNVGVGDYYSKTCKGGQYYENNCTVKEAFKDDYEIYSCPLESGFICPAYGEPFFGYFQSYPSGNPTVVIKEIPKPVDVTVYGWDPKEEREHEESMEVLSAEDGQSNVRIYWRSENATRCECTKSTGGGCGTGFSSVSNESVLATGEPGKGEGNYALTQTTTFKVICDND